MKNKVILYKETNRLLLNEYLFFFIYVCLLLILANILPVFHLYYFVFLFLGIAGISILFIRYKYDFIIKENTLELLLRLPFRLRLLKLDISQIAFAEKINVDMLINIKRPHLEDYRIYIFKKENGLKLTLHNGKVYIIAGVDTSEVIHKIKCSKGA